MLTMYGLEVAGDLSVPVSVGLGGVVAGSVGDVVGVETNVGVRDGCRVAFWSLVAVGTGESNGVAVRDWGLPCPASVAMGVRETICVGLGVSRDGVMLLHAYDDSEQHEQMTQATKKRTTWSVSQEIARPLPMGSTIFSDPSWRKEKMKPLLWRLRLCIVFLLLDIV